MDGDGGLAWLWMVAVAAGPVALGVAIAYVALKRRAARKRGAVREELPRTSRAEERRS